MKCYKSTYRILIVIILLISFSCREEIALETETFESVLVVEATITNEVKRHEVKVSRTFLLEENEQILENNAEVRVTDNTGNSFNFSQNSDGVYISDSTFEALPNIEYTLIINTVDGKTYNSNQQTLTPISQIDNLYPELINDDNNGPGIQIFVDSNNSNPDTKYFRYEFEETYKIVAPFNYSSGVIFSNYNQVSGSEPCLTSVSYDIEFFDITEETQTCFTNKKSTNIIQVNSSNLLENNVLRFPIRFIPEDIAPDVIDASILRDRYSIKLRQYIQSPQAFKYYRILNLLGSNSSVLSETQPGFVEGNIFSLDTNRGRVIGFFEVASVSERRIFFNYQDVNISIPDYIYDCDQRILDNSDNVGVGDFPCDEDINERKELYLLVTNEGYMLGNYDGLSTFTIAKPKCVDCTLVGSNTQPDFWID